MVKAMAPGSCGELVQGTRHGENFLVSCPINRYAVATACLSKEKGVQVFPWLPKTQRAVSSVLDMLGEKRYGVRLEMNSEIPVGVGMASSTADILAATAAAAALFGYRLSPHEQAAIACGVEPSDSLMFKHLTLFNHRRGLVYEDLGPVPPLAFLLLYTGETVDTVAFNARPDLTRLNCENEPFTNRALSLVMQGLQNLDWRTLGLGTTASAIANQHILPKPYLEKVAQAALRLGALGVNVAHSGSVIGILFDPQKTEGEAIARKMQELPFFPTRWEIVRAVSGGALMVEEGSRGSERNLSPWGKCGEDCKRIRNFSR